jgi:flavodoxin I
MSPYLGIPARFMKSTTKLNFIQMKKIAIFYGSESGNTETVAHIISKKLDGLDVHLANIANTSDVKLLEDFDFLILGTSTWGLGDLQDDWERFMPKLKNADLNGKTVALFGLGDSDAYPDTFVDGMADLYEVVTQGGARVVGQVPVDNYNFDSSRAVIDDQFMGLPLDEDNESDLTEKRISDWLADIKPLI